MSSDGTKVTTDPRSVEDPKNENPGIVTSDSLAAESVREGGSFGANADSRGPMAQSSAGLTANTTDVSNATELMPAPDAEARMASEEWNERAELNAGLGQGKDAGRGPTWDIPPRGEALREEALGSQLQPKGTNLQEGGFDSGGPNASFNADIGTKKDPGRRALERMEAANTPYAGGAGPKEGQVSNDGQFDTLGETDA